MIETIGWTVGIILLQLFYYFGAKFGLILVLFDGFFKSFSKYHGALALICIIWSMFGIYELLFVKLCIGFCLFIMNYDQILKKYVGGKKCMGAMLKLAQLTQIESEEIEVMEFVNNIMNNVDDCVNYVGDKYNDTKNMIVNKVGKHMSSELSNDVKGVIKNFDCKIQSVVDFIQTNAMLIGEFLCSISYLEKGKKYLIVGNSLYLKYNNSENYLDSPNLADEMNVGTKLTNIDIDMEKLGGLADLMTDFLSNLKNMEPETNTFENRADFLSLSDVKNKNVEINQCLIDVDEDITKLDEDLFDDEINEMLNKGKINEKQLSHAFCTVSAITSKKENPKISIKLKKHVD